MEYRINGFEPKYVKIYEEEVFFFHEAGYAHLDKVSEDKQDNDGKLQLDLASVLAMEGSPTSAAFRHVSAIYWCLQFPVVKSVNTLSY